MALKVDASFENGVFVPARRPGLAEHERVRLTIEPADKVETASSRSDSSINLDSRTGLAIALDFHPDGC
jgi:predicted DNA-binding antitoxin AbrB/MazE fold protein